MMVTNRDQLVWDTRGGGDEGRAGVLPIACENVWDVGFGAEMSMDILEGRHMAAWLYGNEMVSTLALRNGDSPGLGRRGSGYIQVIHHRVLG